MAKKRREKLSFFMGIISVVMAFFNPFAGLTFGIIGLVQNKNEDKNLRKRAKSLNIWGIVISILMIILSILVTYFLKDLNTTVFPAI